MSLCNITGSDFGSTRLVEVPPSGQIVPLEENVPTIPEEPRRRSTRVRSKPKRLIERM